jgi:hypothetical protein
MKKFTFPLDRVMSWRRAQARLEEAKLARLYTDLRRIDVRESALREDRAQSERTLLSAPATTGFDLAALDAFHRFTREESARLERARVECRQRIASQSQVVTAKRRDLRLLERLKEQRLKAWQIEYGREIAVQADEAFLAKRARSTLLQ